jgi:tryptophanyl-tRNA synthetase
LTTVRERDVLKQNTIDAATDLLALGLKPEQATLFVQSDVPEVSELCWVLMTITSQGRLERCHAFKEKKSKGIPADMGLYTYPVLMAADILAYDSNVVPVGEDQVQHIEVARDLAKAFNHRYGEVFVVPEAKVMPDAARVPGTNGEKMSKSYNNTIEVFEDVKAARKKVMRIETDSRPMEQPKEPDSDHLYQLYSLFVDEPKRQALAERYRAGGFGYGEIKKLLADEAEAFFAPARERRRDLESHPDRVTEILTDGAARARRKAREVLTRVQQACGLSYAAQE